MRRGFWGLWYRQPANQWVEALPLGNGRFGGMVYGGIQRECVILNEETCWDGLECDRTNPEAYEKLSEMRNAIFSGNYEAAEEIGSHMLGIPSELDSYQPLANLDIRFMHAGIFHHYTRSLDLNTAVHRVEYALKSGACFRRDAFVSHPDNLMVMRIEGDAADVDFQLELSRFSDVKTRAAHGGLLLEGRTREGGVGFAALVRVRTEGGEIRVLDGMIQVSGARHAELRIAGATDYRGGVAAEKCAATLDAAEHLSGQALFERHVEDYQSLFMRQCFRLSFDAMKYPTDELLLRFQREAHDPALYEVLYGYLRYQLISSSRPGDMPSNLQGIWNDNMKAPWNSDYHPNINLQINYWAAEAAGLPECVLPLIDWLKAIVPSGEHTAREHYRARGWVLHHISDIFGCTTPMDGPWGIWPFGGAWLCRHLYEHYLYNGDKAYLKAVLPIIEGAALFMLDFLVECPAGLPGEGHLLTCPSHSPENRFRAPNGQITWLTYGAAMDSEIIGDLFTIYLESLRTLGETSDFEADIASARGRLVPPRVAPDGRLMEWIDNYEETEPGHRHVSHLYALYPGVEIGSATPELLSACGRTLERRLQSNYDAQGWCCGWIGALYARLGDGDRALGALDMISDKLLLPNLMVEAHTWPQVGDAQAIAAAIQEMLAQSHEGVLKLLPALPKDWPGGEISGLRLRGGHVMDLAWKNGALTRATLTAGSDGTLRVKYSGLEGGEAQIHLKLGGNYTLF